MSVVKESAVGTIDWPGFRCERCTHEWPSRYKEAELPVVCPNCKSPYWNRPRTQEKKSAKEASRARK